LSTTQATGTQAGRNTGSRNTGYRTLQAATTPVTPIKIGVKIPFELRNYKKR
jgi:hypothetical protein